MKRKINRVVFLLSLFVTIVSCKRGKIEKIEFNPWMMTNLNLSSIDSVTLEEYYKNKLIYSKKTAFKFKRKIDSDNNVIQKQTKFNFKLKKNFVLGYDYKLIFEINKKYYTYYFQKITRDTIYKGQIKIIATKSYILNKKKYVFFDFASFYLDSLSGINEKPALHSMRLPPPTVGKAIRKDNEEKVE